MERIHHCNFCDNQWPCPDEPSCTVGDIGSVCPDCVEVLCTPRRDWVKLKYDVSPNKLICERCGHTREMPTVTGRSLYLDEFAALLNAFGRMHWNCEREETHEKSKDDA